MEKVVNFRSQSFFMEVNRLTATPKSEIEKVSQLFYSSVIDLMIAS